MNQWLAIDVGTVPAVHAQELHHAWECFVEELLTSGTQDEDPAIVREPIAASWRRSFAAGVDPSHHLAPVVADEGETRELWEEHPLKRAAPLIRACLAATAESAASLMVVSDANGVLLAVEGSARVRMRAAESMNFTEGTLWSEPGAGTNAIGTALAVDHAVQVFASEHFNEVVQRWTCSAAPIHDPDTGRLLGVIDLTGDYSTVHPHSLAVAAATAQAVEASLRLGLEDRDARLRARFADRIAIAPHTRALVAPTGRLLTPAPAAWGSTTRLTVPPGGGEVALPSGLRAVAEPVGAAGEAYVVRAAPATPAPAARPLLKLRLLGESPPLLDQDGRQTELRPRLAEILALLCAHPDGLSAEALCAGLHGDGGSASSVRVEVSRLRRLIGPWIETGRYRLTCDIESDARRLQALLQAGAVREAAEAYTGPLLPCSDAPGVVAERDRLDAWLRQAVLTEQDPDALWAWLQSPGGADDLHAWKRLLAQVEFRDPRRSLAAARVAQLREALV